MALPVHNPPIAAALVSQRRAKGLTQQAVADMAHISRRSLSSIEGGKDCTVSTLVGLCDALDLTLTALPVQPTATDGRHFRTPQEMSDHQADREVAEALRVQRMQPLERSEWLRDSWGRLQEQANSLYSGLPAGTGGARHFRTIEEKNIADRLAETEFALRVAARRH
jgi:transcriptional regulator with XRE-family HTH domain